MKKLIYLLVVLLVCLHSTHMLAQNTPSYDKDLPVRITDSVCYVNSVKVGDRMEKVEKVFGRTVLITKIFNAGIYLGSSLLPAGFHRTHDNYSIFYYPSFGLKLLLSEDSLVRAMFLFPIKDSKMGQINGSDILSRNQYNWVYDGMILNRSLPQDVMQYLGVDQSNTGLAFDIPWSKPSVWEEDKKDFVRRNGDLNYSLGKMGFLSFYWEKKSDKSHESTNQKLEMIICGGAVLLPAVKEIEKQRAKFLKEQERKRRPRRRN